MTVMFDDPTGDVGGWASFVSEVARVVDLEPAYVLLPHAGEGWLRGVLEAAAARPGPVLVLPRIRLGSTTGDQRLPGLHKAVIASDDSHDVVRAARVCSLHLLRSGVRTTVVLVLTGQTAPPMWEGTGHHAAAWRAELERRYGRPDRLEVLSGPPGPVVRSRCEDCDLVVLLWRQATADDRAPVVRAVLDEGTTQPSLLVPLDWVERQMAGGWPVPAGSPAHLVG
jgi:hypothetical protein